MGGGTGTADEEKKEKVIKVLSWTVGALGVLFIAGGIYFSSKISNLNKENKENKEIYLKRDGTRVNDYNTLVNKHNSLVERFNSQDKENKNLSNENLGLRKNLGSLNACKSKLADYEKTLDSLEFLKIAYDLEQTKNSQLELCLNEKKDSINLLSSNVDGLEKDLAKYTIMFNSQKDTTNLLQNYLNIYMIVKTPIKEKHRAKVYLPEGEVFVPENKPAIKEIKSLNKEYRKK